MLFAQPLALIAFVALPLFYWLIKQLPPKPLVQYFAPMALLNPQNQEVTAHKPPLLLLIVRLLLISSLILFCAKPYMAETSTHHTKNIHLYIPDDWGTAFAYTEIQKKAKQLIQQAELNNQQVYLQIGESYQKLSHKAALDKINQFVPQKKSIESIQISAKPKQAQLVVLHHGLSEVITDKNSIIHRPKKAYAAILNAQVNDQIEVSLFNPKAAELKVSLRNLTGQLLSQSTTNSNKALLNIPQGAQQGVYIGIEGQEHLGAFYALPFVMSQPHIQILGQEDDFPLLDQDYFLKNALQQKSLTLYNKLDRLSQTDMLILSEEKADFSKLPQWVKQGGILLTFANPEITNNTYIKNLLPFPLKQQPRLLSGSLSWTGALNVTQFTGPLKNIKPYENIKVTQQLLPLNQLTNPKNVWAKLEDGSPFISGHKYGQGYVVHIHVAADARWSSLPLSGALGQIIKQVGQLKQFVSEEQTKNLPPFWLPNSLLKAQEPLPTVSEDAGFYGYQQVSAVKNTSEDVKKQQQYNQGTPYLFEQKIKSYTATFAFLALVFALLDRLLTSQILHKYSLKKAAFIFAILSSFCLLGTKAEAKSINEAAYQPQIAYIPTANSTSDRIIESGLNELAEVLRRRTTLDLLPAHKLQPTDSFGLYPLIYLSVHHKDYKEYIEPLRQFIAQGGLLFIDRHSLQGDQSISAEKLIQQLGIQNLEVVNNKHTLNRSFYLLRGTFVGRANYTEDIWQQKNTDSSPVLIAKHDFTSAWAKNNKGYQKSLLHQYQNAREHSLRFGINLIMYALLGSYKTDQLQTEEIFKRMERQK